MSQASLGTEEQINVKITAVVQMHTRLPCEGRFCHTCMTSLLLISVMISPPPARSVLCGCTYAPNTSSWCPHSVCGCVRVGEKEEKKAALGCAWVNMSGVAWSP